MPMAVDVDGVSKTYVTDGVKTPALNAVSLSVGEAEFVGICGPSGSGKSTLLSLIGGLERPDRGQITVFGQDLGALSDSQLIDFRKRHIGFVFQDFYFLEVLSVRKNVALPLRLRRLSRRQIRDSVDTALDLVGLGHVADKRTRYLSGGEKQRAAIARAFIANPGLIICDEPTGQLDRVNARQVLDLLRALSDRGTTVVMVTHDLVAADACDRVILLDKGRVEPAPRQQAHA
ncbi:putative ABC transport system ATP-binding protein [Rhodothalassium salexigens DSM 2132]|uniref:Putative ABC transport system ATP-binding protein n=1 Tax=Rhodothalassium salexigens DSM 2132 TaxID=1188247 RepID=A0A4V2SNF9_RHOSA|nr:ABC transporter ATP-binding protein [Rhodothalassium salexigens]MBB4212561.1 putative ABC transport system ATP-binding protein [Rhodothalassium salexigens DSM 2132]MBK1639906.1 hypothetical protein [Rhodothalassium salexigens DSM 2132]TCP31106.1 putative ABC transport system ATP-binding protein [Rhodothalassium salexigens DSM 2132]